SLRRRALVQRWFLSGRSGAVGRCDGRGRRLEGALDDGRSLGSGQRDAVECGGCGESRAGRGGRACGGRRRQACDAGLRQLTPALPSVGADRVKVDAAPPRLLAAAGGPLDRAPRPVLVVDDADALPGLLLLVVPAAGAGPVVEAGRTALRPDRKRVV